MKKFFLILGVVLLAAIATYNVSISMNNNNTAVGLALANTEVLAKNENGSGIGCDTKVVTFIEGYIVFIFYECMPGEGNYCQDGWEHWDGWGPVFIDIDSYDC